MLYTMATVVLEPLLEIARADIQVLRRPGTDLLAPLVSALHRLADSLIVLQKTVPQSARLIAYVCMLDKAHRRARIARFGAHALSFGFAPRVRRFGRLLAFLGRSVDFLRRAARAEVSTSFAMPNEATTHASLRRFRFCWFRILSFMRVSSSCATGVGASRFVQDASGGFKSVGDSGR